MIGTFVRPCTKAVKQFTFSTFRPGKDYTNQVNNGSFNKAQGYMTRDAEKVF
jgi:hypothetical protein